ncbi:MAG: hypothetical protein K6F50_07240 [Kiritimatiellae bacterium]|nr:hypothetical protein [Kiritimatiellia bacterium]
MTKPAVICAALSFAFAANAAWYWPFGDDEKEEPRVSELMEPAVDFIDRATDFAEQGKISEAVDAYRKALAELARIELENPERAGKPEFATLRNKRAYVMTSIDSLLLQQAHSNARAVSVTDTTELEKRWKAEQAERKAAEERAKMPKTSSERSTVTEEEADVRRERMESARDSLKRGELALAKASVKSLLAEKPNDAAALNMKAMIEVAEGDDAAAEETLRQLVMSNPRVHYGHYNLARLILRTRGEKGIEAARRAYRTGRDYCNGPVDPKLEDMLK